MSMKVMVRAVKTPYWRPKEDYLRIIVRGLRGVIRDGDIVVVSEKALSTAEGNLVDESGVTPGLMAKLIASVWMRLVWGLVLGRLCHFKPDSIRHLRDYPKKEGAAHKQVALKHAGFLQALKHGSEGGIDLSNLPYSYACLPLKNPRITANKLLHGIREGTGKTVTVILADTDSTFSFHNFYFTARTRPMDGIASFGGVFPFVLGRALRLRQSATPIAVAGPHVTMEEALRFAELAHHTRGYGAGRTAWDVATRFDVGFGEVTWEMLDLVEHHPIVLLRKSK